jgi:Cys-tRNA(Pro)/Cys-tRNA(Cys) deacylase
MRWSQIVIWPVEKLRKITIQYPHDPLHQHSQNKTDTPHNPQSRSYGTEAVVMLGLDERQVFKTLVVSADGELAVAVIPIGQKKKLRTFIDQSAWALDTMYVSAGRRGLEVALRPENLAEVVEGAFVELCSW